ncbi:CDP-6-deoxy-delta-3,4-glucoseen reductase [Burkholderia sp. Bp9140]|uniref:CDP-6-deoxy-delta-3,4-glucoseen reductase n=1 Tax=Burkholderia sp. Bp9140 TaxID=2184572 RepID=UPI000F569474|nr:CDP-6-deoxy-delta-3,4-glucoseen reductase [Burkholderia sp. Bp9140]RQR50012.1 CDP-6-deoxy-delta-3,4-glucoseen reductase [Burkholderia sp. Bp9140]
MEATTRTITLVPSGHTFDVAPGESILGAGIKAGRSLPYSCKTGICRGCRARVRKGTISHGETAIGYLSMPEREQGYALLCQASPETDCEVEVDELDDMTGIRPRVVPCRVIGMSRLAPDVMGLRLRLPMNEKMRFLAGQYVDILTADGRRRSYSIATDPGIEGVVEIELHLRHVSGGSFTDHVFTSMKMRDLLRFEGPLGTFHLREDSTKPIVMLASGTGMAPILAMLRYALRKEIHRTRPITVYWGGRTRADLYLLDELNDLAGQHEGLTFVPVLSDPTTACGWQGRVGLVHHAVMDDCKVMLADAQVYACGAPVMVDAARRDFVEACGLPEQAFFADSFVSEADRVRSAAAG